MLERARKDYVDGETLTYKDLIHGTMKGMLSTLDPHSEFRTLSKCNELKEDTPAFKGSILPRNQILKINGKSTDRLVMGEAVKILRGEPKEISLTREDIGVYTVKDQNNHREFLVSADHLG